MECINKSMGQWVEISAQHAVGFFQRMQEFARHQLGVILALGTGPQAQHRAGKGFNNQWQGLWVARVVRGRAQRSQALFNGAVPVREDGMKQLMLGAVVVAHQRQRHRRFGRDLPQADRVVTLLRKQFFRRQQDGLLAVGGCIHGDCLGAARLVHSAALNACTK